MVIDLLANHLHCTFLGHRLDAALRFLLRPETASLEPPAFGSENSLRIELDQDGIFALVQRYNTKSPADAFWEAHRAFIDVQCVMEGVELMGYAPLTEMQVEKPYDHTKDFAVLIPTHADRAQFVRVDAGMFTIFMPHDAHMPGIAINGSSAMVKKIVVKVPVG